MTSTEVPPNCYDCMMSHCRFILTGWRAVGEARNLVRFVDGYMPASVPKDKFLVICEQWASWQIVSFLRCRCVLLECFEKHSKDSMALVRAEGVSWGRQQSRGVREAGWPSRVIGCSLSPITSPLSPVPFWTKALWGSWRAVTLPCLPGCFFNASQTYRVLSSSYTTATVTPYNFWWKYLRSRTSPATLPPAGHPSVAQPSPRPDEARHIPLGSGPSDGGSVHSSLTLCDTSPCRPEGASPSCARTAPRPSANQRLLSPRPKCSPRRRCGGVRQVSVWGGSGGWRLLGQGSVWAGEDGAARGWWAEAVPVDECSRREVCKHSPSAACFLSFCRTVLFWERCFLAERLTERTLLSACFRLLCGKTARLSFFRVPSRRAMGDEGKSRVSVEPSDGSESESFSDLVGKPSPGSQPLCGEEERERRVRFVTRVPCKGTGWKGSLQGVRAGRSC